MNGTIRPRNSPFIVWGLPLAVAAGCAGALLAFHFAHPPEHATLSGLTFEADSLGASGPSSDDGKRAGVGRLIVTSVKNGGPAEAAGIRAGDVIERIDGMDIHTSGDIDRVLTPHPAHLIHLQLARPGIELDARLPSGEDQDKKSR